jgi:hypothetical protein
MTEYSTFLTFARRKLAWGLLASLLFAACSPTRGCIESDFTLSPESRLPKWFASAGTPRAEATVTMDYWLGLIEGRTATFKLWNAKGRKIAEVVGQQQGNEPLTLEPPGATGPTPYPRYEIITVEGVTEIIEHRRMEPIFYISDDPDVKRKLGVR